MVCQMFEKFSLISNLLGRGLAMCHNLVSQNINIDQYRVENVLKNKMIHLFMSLLIVVVVFCVCVCVCVVMYTVSNYFWFEI